MCCNFITASNYLNERMSRDIVDMDDFFSSLHLPRLYRDQQELQLTCFELIFHRYPLPINDGFISLPPPCRKVSAPNMFALDCEMLVTQAPDGSLWKELARVSVVDHNLELIFDFLVKPRYKISDYLTQYSGLTAEIMADAKLSLRDVQDIFVERFDSTTIFVGHSLEQDLKALRIVHLNIIDTAVLHCRKFSCVQKPKLKYLCALYLNRLIQTGVGHDSIEDAKAAMILALHSLVEPYVFGRYHLPHGIEASMFFESHEQFLQINIIPTHDSMLWISEDFGLEAFVACMTELINTTFKKHPHLLFKICPYYYFMPNFEIGDQGAWGGTFFIGINESGQNEYKLPTNSNDETLEETLQEAFCKIEDDLKLEQLHMESKLLKLSEVPIWVFHPPMSTLESSELESNNGDLGVPEEDRSCTVLPSPTPPSSCEDTLDDVPHFELHLQDLKPTRSPTPTPPPAPNDVLVLAPISRNTLKQTRLAKVEEESFKDSTLMPMAPAKRTKASENKNSKKSRWKRKKRRNKKKIANGSV